MQKPLRSHQWLLFLSAATHQNILPFAAPRVGVAEGTMALLEQETALGRKMAQGFLFLPVVLWVHGYSRLRS